MKSRNQKGFTLIELLIVIVIIGILAGVLIAVIDPGQQQNRARDANVKATLNKVALASEGFNSAYGRAPNGNEFLANLQNAAIGSGGCLADGDFCHFTVSGNALPFGASPVGCNTDWAGDGAGQCEFRYWRDVNAVGTSTHFRLYGKSFGLPSTVFMYDNGLGEISDCASATVSDTACL